MVHVDHLWYPISHRVQQETLKGLRTRDIISLPQRVAASRVYPMHRRKGNPESAKRPKRSVPIHLCTSRLSSPELEKSTLQRSHVLPSNVRTTQLEQTLYTLNRHSASSLLIEWVVRGNTVPFRRSSSHGALPKPCNKAMARPKTMKRR